MNIKTAKGKVQLLHSRAVSRPKPASSSPHPQHQERHLIQSNHHHGAQGQQLTIISTGNFWTSPLYPNPPKPSEEK
jgi:hypothetical protein